MRLHAILAGFCAVLVLSAAADAAPVVNFHNSSRGLFVGQGALSDSGNNVWNGFTASGTTISGNKTSTGTATPINFTATYGFNNGANAAADQGLPRYLLGNQAGVNANSGSKGTFVLDNVPAGTYQVYLYGTNFDHNRGTTFSFDPSNGGVADGTDSTLNSTIDSYIKGDNYVIFNGLHPDVNGKITGNWIPNPADGVGNPNLAGEGSFNGLQLVAGVPEPASLGLLALSGAGLLARRRRV
jgi:hypothetical protein